MLAEKLISFVSLQINLGQSDFDKLVGYTHGTRHKPEGVGCGMAEETTAPDLHFPLEQECTQNSKFFDLLI